VRCDLLEGVSAYIRISSSYLESSFTRDRKMAQKGNQKLVNADFLTSYIDFRQHIEELYGDLSNVDKGRKFSTLVKDTLSSHEDYWGLEARLNSKESHDGGVDIFWNDPETGENLIFCQAKFRIRSKDDLDNVISKFKSFEDSTKNSKFQKDSQLDMFAESQGDDFEAESGRTKYIVATLWSLKRITSIYGESGRPSVSFFNKLLDEKCIEILDGEILYDYFLDAYQREYSIPQSVSFRSAEPLINRGNVHVGIINSEDLIGIYKNSRNGIFFENVRDFIGLGNSDSALDINNDIYKTARKEPSKMIERNNGITFKASSIEYEEGWVRLTDAGIINGCQTTICIVKAKPKDECYVPVKIVITGNEQNSSNIARTANTQNRIDKINLELSEFIRPQLIKMSLAEVGISLEESEQKNAPILAATISKYQIFKIDIRYLFIGLFSYVPRNIFISDYASIRFDDLRECVFDAKHKRELNATLAQLLVFANDSFEEIRKKYPLPSNKDADLDSPEAKVGKVFNRFYVDQKGYKSYLIVLAIYCMMEIGDEKASKKLDVTSIISFVQDILDFQGNTCEFHNAIEKVFRAVAMNVIQKFTDKDKDLEDEISQNLFKYMRSTNFSAFYMVYGML